MQKPATSWGADRWPATSATASAASAEPISTPAWAA